MVEHTGEQLRRLLARGDRVEVERGRLSIIPASGRPVPSEWLEEHERPLIAEAARAAGIEALEYLGYSVGNYGRGRWGGVTLQFRSLVDGRERYAIFNAETRRHRNTKHGKAGDPLPRGQFRVGKRSLFLSFWRSTGLPEPPRLSAFHDYMGKLSSLVFTASPSNGEKLKGKSLRPLSIAHGDLPRLLGVKLPDNCRTTPGQLPNNFQTRNPDKESPQTKQPCGLEPFLSTGQNNYGYKVTRAHGYTVTPVPPQEQTNDQWLADYLGVH